MFHGIKACFWGNHAACKSWISIDHHDHSSHILDDHVLFPYYQNDVREDEDLPWQQILLEYWRYAGDVVSLLDAELNILW
jgi:hypothetical protein